MNVASDQECCKFGRKYMKVAGKYEYPSEIGWISIRVPTELLIAIEYNLMLGFIFNLILILVNIVMI